MRICSSHLFFVFIQFVRALLGLDQPFSSSLCQIMVIICWVGGCNGAGVCSFVRRSLIHGNESRPVRSQGWEATAQYLIGSLFPSKLRTQCTTAPVTNCQVLLILPSTCNCALSWLYERRSTIRRRLSRDKCELDCRAFGANAA